MTDQSHSDQPQGAMTAAELEYLARHASWIVHGDIVELGSSRGRSAAALAKGVGNRDGGALPVAISSIEPHRAPSHGDEAAPSTDRAAFYQAILSSGASDSVAVLDMPSVDAAKTWKREIALLLINEVRAASSVQSELNAWLPHLMQGAAIMFGEAFHPGPTAGISRLLASGDWEDIGGVDSIRTVRHIVDPEKKERWARIRSAHREIGDKAQEQGYDRDRTIQRLTYGTYVSASRRYMYLETPKAACTAVKEMVLAQEQVSLRTDQPPYHSETRLDMLIHQRRYVPIPNLFECGQEMRTAIMTGAPDWFVFAIVRNPFSRLVSVFENKVLLNEPRYEGFYQRYNDLLMRSGYAASFRAFAAEVCAEASVRHADPHLTPQATLIMPRLFPYMRIFRLETVDEAVEAFKDHLAAVGSAVVPSLPERNLSRSVPWRACYDAETAKAVAEAYSDDFAAFQYDPLEWRPRDSESSIVLDRELDRYWRSEVVERNRFIDYLYCFTRPQT